MTEAKLNFCTNCGTKLENDVKFCTSCGSGLEVSKTNSQSSESAQEQRGDALAADLKQTEDSTEIAPVQNGVKVEQVPKPPRKPLGKKAKLALVAAVVAAVLAIGGFVGFSLQQDSIGPASVAVRYVEAVRDSDVDTVWELLGLQESTFVTREILARQLESFPGSTVVAAAEGEDSTDYSAIVVLTLEDGSFHTLFLTKVNDSWIVNDRDIFMRNNFTISSDFASSASLDGIKLEEVEPGVFETGPILLETYQLEVTSLFFNPYQRAVSVSGGNLTIFDDMLDLDLYFSVLQDAGSLTLRQEIVDQLTTEAPALVENYMTLFFNEASADEIADVFYRGRFDRDDYRSAQERFRSRLGGKPLYSMELSDVSIRGESAQVSVFSLEDGLGFEVVVQASGTAVGEGGMWQWADNEFFTTPGRSTVDWEVNDIAIVFIYDKEAEAFGIDSDSIGWSSGWGWGRSSPVEDAIEEAVWKLRDIRD